MQDRNPQLRGQDDHDQKTDNPQDVPLHPNGWGFLPHHIAQRPEQQAEGFGPPAFSGPPTS